MSDGFEMLRTASTRATVDAVRARLPDRNGFAVRNGVRLHYEVFGDASPTVLLLPTWAIVHSRIWKAQVPFLARHYRVITFDPRGNGRSDRPSGPAAYDDRQLVADALAVLDVVGARAVVAVGLSAGGRILLQLAAGHPDRISAAVFVAPALPFGARPEHEHFEMELGTTDGWAKYNAHYWRSDLDGFAQFFFERCFVEAHSTKQIEDAVSWTRQTDAETLIATECAPRLDDGGEWDDASTAEFAARVQCPSLVVHGDKDEIVPLTTGTALATLLNCPTEVFAGAGHCVPSRHPVRFNRTLQRFVEQVA